MRPEDLVQSLLETPNPKKHYNDDWQPSKSDIEWVRRTLSMIKEGGHWITSEGVYQVDHRLKTLTLIQGYKAQIFHRTAKVLPLIGWTMSDPAVN